MPVSEHLNRLLSLLLINTSELLLQRRHSACRTPDSLLKQVTSKEFLLFSRRGMCALVPLHLSSNSSNVCLVFVSFWLQKWRETLRHKNKFNTKILQRNRISRYHITAADIFIWIISHVGYVHVGGCLQEWKFRHSIRKKCYFQEY